MSVDEMDPAMPSPRPPGLRSGESAERQHVEPGSDVLVRPVQWKNWLAVVLTVIVVVALASALISNPNVHWPVVATYLFDPGILSGVGVTVALTVLTMFFGSLLGLLIASFDISGNMLLRSIARGYVWIFRSIPPLVQIIFWYNLALFLPRVDIGLPFSSVEFVQLDMNELISPFLAALVGFSLNEAGYMAEIFRSGYLGVPVGQREAARGLGMTGTQVFRKVVAPQALRIVLPPTGNETITVLKGTAVVFAISVADLLTEAQIIFAANFEVIALLIVVSLWYMALASVLMVGQRLLERRLADG